MSKRKRRKAKKQGKSFKKLLTFFAALVLLVTLGWGILSYFSRQDDSRDPPDIAVPEEPEAPAPETEPELPEEEIDEEAETVPEVDQPAYLPDDVPSQAADQELIVIEDGDDLLAPVNKKTTLKSAYVPGDLKPIPSHMNPSYDMLLRAEALQALEELYRAAAEEEVILHVRSAYRSYATQEYLFNDYALRYGPEEANKFSARPGQSEHQLGTTVDFGGTEHDFTAAFAQTKQGLWLADNAYRFGFVLSYPEGKMAITGYIYEPWHYRYIGREMALEWKNSGLTLTEFLIEKRLQ